MDYALEDQLSAVSRNWGHDCSQVGHPRVRLDGVTQHALFDCASPPAAQLAALAEALGECLLADRARLEQRVRRLRRLGSPPPSAAMLADLARAVVRSRELYAARAALPLRLEFPPELPFSAHVEAIAALVAGHRVVIVSGETGCGKSTQLPKLCLRLGRGLAGRIGHTQPRRIAARAVAARLAEETATRAGTAIGHCVRFEDNLAPVTRVKVMTDGILLHEIERDPLLLQYDTLIIDELHERSLNIDFLLAYLKRLQARRDDLKLILTSATLDAAQFVDYFADAVNFAIPGRTHPIELRYQPPPADGDAAGDPLALLTTEVLRLVHEASGDILAFLPGEREIDEAQVELAQALPADIEILPLFARLSAARQARVFAPGAARRVILTTNVAETSLTVPRVRHVIDTGLARVSRYSPRRKLQVLQVERIAQANAEQRAGRCGRQQPGVCVRLYSETDFAARRACTEPEIQRTNLAGVILRLKALGIDDIDGFPFADPPPPRLVKDGHAVLQELGALAADGSLSATGRRLLRFPIDPRFARVLVAASELGCLAECLVIVAGLSIVDPRERPHARRSAADQAHAVFADRRSDFLWFWRAWPFVRELMAVPARRRARRAARHYLSAMRLREWVELHDYLARLARAEGLAVNPTAASYKLIHIALATGFPTQVGEWQGEHYAGCRGTGFVAHPASVLARQPPRWVLAGEIVETERRYARNVARIEPAWLERAAGHLLKRSYAAPHWDARRGAVRATEIQRLFGLVINAAKPIDYARIDPLAARAIFIDAALVDGRLGEQPPAFLAHNLAVVACVQELEARARRRDLLAPRGVVQDFYCERLPPTVLSRRDLMVWLRADPVRERTLLMRESDITTAAHATVAGYLFPDRIEVAGTTCMLRYRYAPDAPDDGLTVQVPLAVLARLRAAELERLVPGLLSAKVEALLRALPKSLRRQVSPLREFAMAAVDAIADSPASLADALASALERITGRAFPPALFDSRKLPAYYTCRLEVVAEDGTLVGSGRDLVGLQSALAAPAAAACASLTFGPAARSAGGWHFGTLPECAYARSGAHLIRGYPALVAVGEAVEVQVFAATATATSAHRAGIARLLLQVSGSQQRELARALDGERALALRLALFGHTGSFARSLVAAAAWRWTASGSLPRDAAAFAALEAAFAGAVAGEASATAQVVASLLARGETLRSAVLTIDSSAARTDLLSQLQLLLGPRVVAQVDAGAAARLQRYLLAIERRLDRLRGNPGKDGLKLAVLSPLWERFLALRAGRAAAPADDSLQFMFEDFRLGLFAPELGGSAPVDHVTLAAALDAWAAQEPREGEPA